jgi:monomeric sarcosine oxidase
MAIGHAEVIVIGGGTMGTAAGWALARMGREVIVLEQYEHVHAMGSHGGNTRIIRHAYAEGPDYVPLVLEADNLWQKLEQETGQILLTRTGALDISRIGGTHARSARASAEKHGIEFEWLPGSEVSRRWPVWRFDDEFEACFSPGAGFLKVAPALRAMASEMTRYGGRLRTNERVSSWSADEHGITVSTSAGDYSCERLIVAAGAWNGKLLAGLGLPLEVRRKPVLWFQVDDRDAFAPEWFPVFMVQDGGHELYGLPITDDPGLKVGEHTGGDVVSPDTVERKIRPSDVTHAVGPFINAHLDGVRVNVADSSVCMYTVTPDEDFIIDRDPRDDRVIFAAGFSGHGFKFAPVIGQHLAALATDPTTQPYPDFAVARFQAAPA